VAATVLNPGPLDEARVLFVNLTRRCNIDCPRCYLTPAHRAAREALDPALLEAALGDPFFRDHAGPVVVIHQGGEPQLLGRHAFGALVEVVGRVAPFARQTAVSNMVAAPDWFLDLAGDWFEGRIETTWAAGRKHTLAGDGPAYQAAFSRSLARAVEAGLVCPINVEVNDDTIAAGPQALIAMMLKTGARHCEFDLSFDFQAFRAAPAFGPGGAPLVAPTVPYSAVSAYLLALRRQILIQGLAGRVQSHSLVPLAQRGTDLPFNTRGEARFVTLNPDGTVTTNPLYSDVEATYLGSLRTHTLSELLAHPNRLARIAQEEARCAPCAGCRHWDLCRGGPSHAPWGDGQGECAGLRAVLDRL